MTRRVLLIEDDLFSATVLADALRERGWEVEHASSGADGLARALRDRPDAVVTDLALPGVDGATIAATLRLAPGRRTPLVLVSARDASAELAESAGADLFFEKPVPVAALHEALERLIAAAQPADGLEFPGPVRLPEQAVLGDGPTGPGTWTGAVEPDWLPALLGRLFERRATGVLEVEGEPGRARVFFHRGAPAAARSSEGGTELGRVLERLGALTPARVEASVAEARRRGRPLADELVATAQLGRATAERALREQILERILALAARSAGRWTFVPSDPVGLPGYEVPTGVAWWRLGAPIEGEPPAARHHVRLHGPAWAWALLDPDGALGGLHARLVGGATVAECRAAAPELGDRLIRVLHRFGLLALVDDPPTDAQRQASAALLDAAKVEAELTARARALADADYYTLLGLAPDAPPGDVHLANVQVSLDLDPDRLPPGISAAGRERAHALFARVLEAGRVLVDPERRALYDAMLARRGRWSVSPVSSEGPAVLLAERGRHCFRRGEYVTAASLLRAALRLEGLDADILAMLGRARHLACPEDLSAGEAELRRAVEADPEGDFPLYWLARLHYERGELEESRRLLRQLLTHNPEFELAREAMRLFP